MRETLLQRYLRVVKQNRKRRLCGIIHFTDIADRLGLGALCSFLCSFPITFDAGLFDELAMTLIAFIKIVT